MNNYNTRNHNVKLDPIFSAHNHCKSRLLSLTYCVWEIHANKYLYSFICYLSNRLGLRIYINSKNTPNLTKDIIFFLCQENVEAVLRMCRMGSRYIGWGFNLTKCLMHNLLKGVMTASG